MADEHRGWPDVEDVLAGLTLEEKASLCLGSDFWHTTAVKVPLEPGHSTPVSLVLDQRAFAFWSAVHHDWVVEAGTFEVAVGASSRDLRLTKTVDIEAPERRPPISATSTLQEWLTDPAAAAALASLFADDSGQVQGFLAAEGLVEVIGSYPMDRLAAFPGFGLDRTTLDDLAVGLAKRRR